MKTGNHSLGTDTAALLRNACIEYRLSMFADSRTPGTQRRFLQSWAISSYTLHYPRCGNQKKGRCGGYHYSGEHPCWTTTPRGGTGCQVTTVVWGSLKLKADGQSEPRSVQNLLEVSPSRSSFVLVQCIYQLRFADLVVLFRYLSCEVAAYEEIVTDRCHVGGSSIGARGFEVHYARRIFFVYDYVFWCSAELSMI